MYERFEAAVDRAVADGKIAGAVALTVDRSGPVYQHAAGLRQLGASAAMTTDTVFWIASMTKALVSIAALQLVEAGKIGLDDDLGGVLPDLADLQVLEGLDAEGKPKLRPAAAPVTLRHLLSHTSGFAYSFTSEPLLAFMQATGAADPNSGARAALRTPLMFDPGQGFVYGIGIDWAGLVVEAVSGQRLDAYMRDHVLAPLGMADTGFALSDEQKGRQAGVHALTPGGLAPIPFGLPENPEVLSGGGGLYSTAGDYGRFLRMLLNGGELDGVTILSRAGIEGLAEVHTGSHRVRMASSLPHLSNTYDPYPEMATGHGLAAMVTPEPTSEGRRPGSLAWAGLANTYYWADPESGRAGVLMTQLLPFADPAVLDLFKALERDAYGVA